MTIPLPPNYGGESGYPAQGYGPVPPRPAPKKSPWPIIVVVCAVVLLLVVGSGLGVYYVTHKSAALRDAGSSSSYSAGEDSSSGAGGSTGNELCDEVDGAALERLGLSKSADFKPSINSSRLKTCVWVKRGGPSSSSLSPLSTDSPSVVMMVMESDSIKGMVDAGGSLGDAYSEGDSAGTLPEDVQVERGLSHGDEVAVPSEDSSSGPSCSAMSMRGNTLYTTKVSKHGASEEELCEIAKAANPN